MHEGEGGGERRICEILMYSMQMKAETNSLLKVHITECQNTNGTDSVTRCLCIW
jgi:hypothetical protein